MTLPGKTRNLKPPANPPPPPPPMPPASVTAYKGPRPWDDRAIHHVIATTDPHQSLTDAVAAARQVPCFGCGRLTGTRANVPGRPDLGSVPMHLSCSAMLVSALGSIERREPIHPVDEMTLRQVQRNLGVWLIPKPTPPPVEETIAKFHEPRYSIVDLQRAYREGQDSVRSTLGDRVRGLWRRIRGIGR